jgi:hypothetical protein
LKGFQIELQRAAEKVSQVRKGGLPPPF